MFTKIFLMAADEDDDAFEREDKFLHLPDMGEELYVYFNRKDTALQFSDKTKFNPDRLGNCGPKYPANLPHKVCLIDITQVNVDIVGHNYLENNPKVVSDLNSVLSGKVEDLEIPGRKWNAQKNKFVLV